MENHLDNLIFEINYLLLALMAYRDIEKSGNCNECVYQTCGYMPGLSKQVRYNCPFFQRDKEEGNK